MTTGNIGELREQHLHAALKEWYREEGDLLEVGVDGFVIDLIRDEILIEIQTRGFSSMRRKLDRLLDAHPIRLVHPIAAEKWIRKIDDSGVEVSRKKSPKRGMIADVCAELVSFPSLLSHPNLTLEVLLVQEEEVRRPDPKAWRRNGWGIAERRLVGILERVVFDGAEDLLTLLPPGLPDPFTTAHLAEELGRSRHLAQEVAYCLREAGVLDTVGRSRGGIEYARPVGC
ncbi:MAG: hypothetical protein HKN80_10390 [Acidimicrobiia bacterium]|nr:hypothetical protein [Acidimicrobiia bacterium]